MKISKTTIFFFSIFAGHFIISPIRDGRAKILFDRLTDSKAVFKNDNKKKELNSTSDIYYNGSDIENELSEHSKSATDNRADQMNSNNNAYWQSRGYKERPDNWQNGGGGNSEYSQAELDNHANQMNPDNEAYHSSRGK